MKKKWMRAVSISMLWMMLFTACGSQQDKTEKGKIGRVTTSDTYPLETDEKILWWVQLHELVPSKYKSLTDTPFAQALCEQTGINVEFIHAPHGEEHERLALMISADMMPDIVEYNWANQYNGGISQAIYDGVIMELDDVIEKVSPHFRKYLEQNPNIARDIKTEEGHYAYYPMCREDKRLATFRGWMIRSDLMETVGIHQVPTTLDEFETLVYRFRDAGVEIPVSVVQAHLIAGENTSLAGAFGICCDFYVKDGVVKYGPCQPEYQEFIQRMAKWYADGILDKKFIDNDADRQGNELVAGKIGAIYASAGGHFGDWLPRLKENIPNATMEPMPYLVRNKGERAKFGQYNNLCEPYGAAITAKCKNPELAARLLDYGYSPEGHNLYNFGVEGISYEMQDGVPVYTKEVTDSEYNGGLSMGEGISKYARASYFGPFVQDYNYVMQYYRLPEQKRSLEIWSDTDAYKYKLPNLILPRAESVEYTQIMDDVLEVQNEMVLKYINGQLNANDMSLFVKELENMGINRAIKIKQDAYDRYINN